MARGNSNKTFHFSFNAKRNEVLWIAAALINSAKANSIFSFLFQFNAIEREEKWNWFGLMAQQLNSNSSINNHHFCWLVDERELRVAVAERGAAAQPTKAS